jgi:hypothetical protein
MMDNVQKVSNFIIILSSQAFESYYRSPSSPSLDLLDFSLFGPLKQHLGGLQFHGTEEVEMAIGKWL